MLSSRGERPPSGNAADGDIKTALEARGAVLSAAVIKDKLTGDSRGFRFGLYSWRGTLWLYECFGFVEMPNKGEEERSALDIYTYMCILDM